MTKFDGIRPARRAALYPDRDRPVVFRPGLRLLHLSLQVIPIDHRS